MSNLQWTLHPLSTARFNAAATMLPDERILLAGGSKQVPAERKDVCDFQDPCSLASAEVFDPSTGRSTPVADMPAPRESGLAVPTKHGVLIVGGLLSGGACVRSLQSACVWELSNNTWEVVAAPPSGFGPSMHGSFTGDPGIALLVGGMDARITSACWRLRAMDEDWRPCAPMHHRRYLHGSARLPDGRVMVAGGLTTDNDDLPLRASSSVEVYDPRGDTWERRESLVVARAEHTLTPLADGTVLAIGGMDDEGDALASAELFDPASGRWLALPTLDIPRIAHTATLLPDGRVLILGGLPSLDTAGAPVRPAALFDPATARFETAPGPREPRWGHVTFGRRDGSVVVLGGTGTRGSLASAEVGRLG